MKTIKLSIALFFLTAISLVASKYDDARELYKEGPTKGLEIIKLLKEHLAVNPADEKALRLLGITEFGVGKNKEALNTFDKAIVVAGKDGSISPSLLMYKARALFALKRKYECKRILEVYWAFWQDEGKLEELYDWYWDKVKNELPPKTKNSEQDGAEQPATTPQSKSQGNKNTKQESKGCSQ